MLLAFDTETTGLDHFHGVRPFFVTCCSDDDVQHFWEWDINPLTRMPIVLESDLQEIGSLIFGLTGDDGPRLVAQNSKFDVHALSTVLPSFDWSWEYTEDTLAAGHVLASNQPHNLTDMALAYLGVDIRPFEDRLEHCVKAARAFCRAHLKNWRIAKKDQADMPSAKDKTWKYDSWLPRALAKWEWESSMAFNAWRDQDHTDDAGTLEKKVAWLPGWECRPPELNGEDERWTVLSQYGNADSAVTIKLWQVMERLLKERDLWEIYRAKVKTVEIAWEMERRGVTVNDVELTSLRDEFREESERCERVCCNIAVGTTSLEQQEPWVADEIADLALDPLTHPHIAADFADEQGLPIVGRRLREVQVGFELELPKAGNNKSLTNFIVEGLRLPIRRWTAGGKSGKNPQPQIDKNALEEWENELERSTLEHLFIKSLRTKRRLDTAIGYLDAYERFMLPLGKKGWHVLHPNMNPMGTDTTRWSSNNPNSTNVSKQEVKCQSCDGHGCEMCDGKGMIDLNLRRCLGPAPGREWWSLDAKNIERRIPAYKTEEHEIIALIERPDDPPYFGSEHGLVAHLLWPKEFKECGDDARLFKKRYAATLYQWIKNGNFALQYGCQERKGDATYHQQGAWRKVKQRFAKQENFNKQLIAFANKHGYVETVPDRSVNPRRGYPLLCSRADNGFILPTVPMNYWCQGTACWAVSIRWIALCHEKLKEWRRADPTFDGFICLDVHDELVFDMPRRGDPVAEVKLEKTKPAGKPHVFKSNLPKIRTIQQQLRRVGEDLGVPLECGAEFHDKSYAEGVSL